MKLVLTGFGPFGLVADNPSRIVAQEASELLRSTGINCSFVDLETSMQSVDAFYSALLPESDVFVFHLGVDSTKSKFAIETVARNITDFTRADRQGCAPKNQPILADQPLDYCLRNPLDLAPLGAEMGDLFEISDDAGTFVCNYAYFYGLANLGTKIRGCAFVHVPGYRPIPIEEQVEKIATLARKILSLPVFQ
jgi:pyrrolidone-carboxylate peptidase